MWANDPDQRRPRLFIASSIEGRRVAEAIQCNLEGDIETTVWCQGVFRPADATLATLDRVSRDVDFAVVVFTADDLTVSRGETQLATRDNVLLEVGMFIGRLGVDRTFVVSAGDEAIRVPSNLAGVTLATYSARSDGNLQAALGPPCTHIKDRILRLAGEDSSQPPVPDSHPEFVRRRRRPSLGIAHSVGPKISMRLVNVSVSGALLETAGELPIGKVLDLDLELDGGVLIHVLGQVVRIQRPDWMKTGGIGVKFTAINEGDLSVLEQYVNADAYVA